MKNPYMPKFLIRDLEPAIKAIELDAYLDHVSSPLKGMGGFIKDVEECFKINSIFILAIIGLESSWGKSNIAKTKHNLMGWGAIDNDPMNGSWMFQSHEGCIMTVCHYLDRQYLTRDGKYYVDGTVGGIGKKYASDKEWGKKICDVMNGIMKFIEELGHA